MFMLEHDSTGFSFSKKKDLVCTLRNTVHDVFSKFHSKCTRIVTIFLYILLPFKFLFLLAELIFPIIVLC